MLLKLTLKNNLILNRGSNTPLKMRQGGCYTHIWKVWTLSFRFHHLRDFDQYYAVHYGIEKRPCLKKIFGAPCMQQKNLRDLAYGL